MVKLVRTAVHQQKEQDWQEGSVVIGVEQSGGIVREIKRQKKEGAKMKTGIEFRKLRVADLKPAEYNPRKDLQPGDYQYECLKVSIEEFGYVDPIIVNKDLTVIGGHQRLKVLTNMGYTEVECSMVDLDKIKEKELNIRLNSTGGEFTKDALGVLIKEIEESGRDINTLGFEPKSLDDIMSAAFPNQIEDDDFEPVLPEVPISKQGDIWLLGRHRLLCGDSTLPESYEKLMDGKQANLIVTDPPYNVDYEGTAGKIQNDNMADDKFKEFLLSAFKGMFGVLADGGGIYVFHADKETVNFRTAFKEAGFFCHQTCIWKKDRFVPGRCDYQYMHEPVLVGWKPNAGHKWYGDRKQSTIWEFDKPRKSEEHPTMKPIPLIAYPIENSSTRNNIVLDPFGGSGSTLIACEQTDRICHTIEYDERYVDVIVNRYISQRGDSKGVYLVRDGLRVPYDKLEKGGE